MAANVSDSDGDIFEVEELLDHRGRGKNVEYLVRWRTFGEEEDSWEPLKNLGSAEEAVQRYKEKLTKKTPRRVSRSRDVSQDSVTKLKKSTSKAATREVVTTKTVVKTETVSKLAAKDSQLSESSSPEASPTVTRKSLRPRQSAVEAVSSTNTAAPATSGLRPLLSAPCALLSSIRHVSTKDIPVIVLISCLTVIASSFYISGY